MYADLIFSSPCSSLIRIISENTGDCDVILLEILKAPKFSDVSLSQWIAETPPQIIKDHLMLEDDIIDKLTSSARREKQYVVY